jgi:DNA-binding transcriptional LysR family regulator
MDLALMALPIPGAEFRSRALLREPLFVAVAKNHRLAREKSLTLRHLESHPFLLLKEATASARRSSPRASIRGCT